MNPTIRIPPTVPARDLQKKLKPFAHARFTTKKIRYGRQEGYPGTKRIASGDVLAVGEHRIYTRHLYDLLRITGEARAQLAPTDEGLLVYLHQEGLTSRIFLAWRDLPQPPAAQIVFEGEEK